MDLLIFSTPEYENANWPAPKSSCSIYKNSHRLALTQPCTVGPILLPVSSPPTCVLSSCFLPVHSLSSHSGLLLFLRKASPACRRALHMQFAQPEMLFL